MTLDTENLINSIMESLDRVQFVKAEDIPNIDLYMDQVTTFIDSRLKNTARYKDQDKILTKTMINNYAKNNLLPAPDKKKYTSEHILVLIFIYYFKNILSISDIQMLLNPLTERYFGKNKDFSIGKIYDEVMKMGNEQLETLKKDVIEKYTYSESMFTDAEEDEKEFLQIFSFICMLSFDVYVKKLMIEKMLDEYHAKHSSDPADKKTDKKAENKKRTNNKKES